MIMSAQNRIGMRETGLRQLFMASQTLDIHSERKVGLVIFRWVAS